MRSWLDDSQEIRTYFKFNVICIQKIPNNFQSFPMFALKILYMRPLICMYGMDLCGSRDGLGSEHERLCAEPRGTSGGDASQPGSAPRARGCA